MPTFTKTELRNMDGVRRYCEILDNNDKQGAKEFFDPEFATSTHDWKNPDGTTMKGPDVMIALAAMLHGGLSNLKTEITKMVASDDWVMYWTIQTGFHDRGYIMGQAPTYLPWEILIGHITYFRKRKPYFHEAVRNDQLTVDLQGKLARQT